MNSRTNITNMVVMTKRARFECSVRNVIVAHCVRK